MSHLTVAVHPGRLLDKPVRVPGDDYQDRFGNSYSIGRAADLQYEVVEYREGWGYLPIFGTAGGKMPATIEAVKGRPISLLSEAEYRLFICRNYPASFDALQERIDESMMSAAL